MTHYTGLIEKYRDRLPVAPNARVISLGEGDTKLIELKNLPALVRKKVRILAKFDGLNPTGSFKDRGMTMAVTQAVEEGARAIICASTGNTSASAAAYAARAGIACFVLIPEGKIALGKLSQAIDARLDGAADPRQFRRRHAPGAGGGADDAGQHRQLDQSLPHPGAEDDCLRDHRGSSATFRTSTRCRWETPATSPRTGSAIRNACGESTQALQDCPGMRKYATKKISSRRPIMLGYQASGSAPIVRGRPVENPETIATAIRIGNPVSWQQAVAASKESGGWFAECTDEEILHVQKLLAQAEGMFCEPASAISLAGLLKDLELGKVGEGSTIVCTLTGHGLKDPDVAIAQSAKPMTVDAELKAIEQVIRRHLPK